MFAQNKEDRKRVEKALDASGFPSAKNDAISPQKFTFEDFFNFYKNLTQRSEIEKIFEELCGSSKRKLMTAPQLVDFLNQMQRDPRLNEILHPYANPARSKDLISQYEPNKYNAARAQLSLDGFLRYLMSEDNPIMATSKIDLADDMDQPLAHYFINSSHNTYLTAWEYRNALPELVKRKNVVQGWMLDQVVIFGNDIADFLTMKDVVSKWVGRFSVQQFEKESRIWNMEEVIKAYFFIFPPPLGRPTAMHLSLKGFLHTPETHHEAHQSTTSAVPQTAENNLSSPPGKIHHPCPNYQRWHTALLLLQGNQRAGAQQSPPAHYTFHRADPPERCQLSEDASSGDHAP
ncbi:phosphatidylinositol phospholipase C activity protein [Homalodisca vitripennis]|nr:phosphatidylinositol phospholipase C activity protein [Homalodisca vitripennis]